MGRSWLPPPSTLPAGAVRDQVRDDQRDLIIFLAGLTPLNEFVQHRQAHVRLVGVVAEGLFDPPLELLPPLLSADLRETSRRVDQANCGGDECTDPGDARCDQRGGRLRTGRRRRIRC